MITNEQCKSFLPGNQLMGDLNNDPNVGIWPIYHEDKPSSNGQFHDPYSRRTIADAYFGYHTESVRQKMLEHEAVFQTQLYELHRLYRVQRELMDDLKMNELQKQSMAIETSMPSCSASQRPDAQRSHTSLRFPLSSSSSAQLAVMGAKDLQSIPDSLHRRHSQNGLVSPSNPGSSRNCEVEILGCRPSTARRKFDLELKADEYIDVEEPKYQNSPGMSHYLSNGSCDVPHSSTAKMFLGRSITHDNREDEGRKNKGENGLVDLNEQIQTQRLKTLPLNFVGYGSSFQSNQESCSKSQIQNTSWESMPNSHFGRETCSSRNLTTALRENGRDWSHSHMLNSERGKGQSYVSQNLLPGNIDFFSKDRNASYFQNYQIKAEHRKERFEGGPQHCGSNILNGSNPYMEKSISTSKAPWEKSDSCMTQKSRTAETYPFLTSTSTLPRSLQSSSNSKTLGESWHVNSGGVNKGYQNGLYGGSCSGSGAAFSPAIGYNYLNHINKTYVASGASVCQNGSVKLKGLTSVDASSAKGIDLNIATSVTDRHGYDDRPNQEYAVHLPWVKSSVGLNNGNETTELSNGCITRHNTGHDMAIKATTTKMIMGVPIFGDSHLFKGSLSCRASLSKEEEMGKNGRVRGFDMNLPCEHEETDIETHTVNRTNLIDLNMCLAEDDAVMEIPTPCSHPEKTVRGFDLEASCDMEEEDMIQLKQQMSENSDGGLVTTAAETIVAMSSRRNPTLTNIPSRNPAEATQSNVLKWFVDIVSPCPDGANKLLPEISEGEADSVDYFECMTLQLAETKEDEYLPEYPKPSEPEEEMGTGLYTTRTRKGQARRGRPRRDFQRDILPGLTSLARHEVTEDLQTLGGLMRATGHSWQSSITRRAGPRRGRPRLTPVPLPPPNTFSTPYLPSPLPPEKPPSPFCTPSPQKKRTTTLKEIVNMEEDHGNLTGWGKTTRRPRRQRCSTASAVQRIT